MKTDLPQFILPSEFLNCPFGCTYCATLCSFNFSVKHSSGKKEERNYENGVLNGQAVIFGTDGDKFEFTYVDGIISGTYYYIELRILNDFSIKNLHPPCHICMF